jgi:ABC-type branched-subunit amino acid transport system ATPase component
VSGDDLSASRIVVCEDVSWSFGGVQAVDQVSIALRKGRVTGLIGPNGAGKSTLINVLSGYLRGQSGRVLFNGTDISRAPAHAVARRGLVRTFQLSSEFPHMTVLENMLVGPAQVGESFWTAVFRPGVWRRQEKELLAEARTLLDEFDLLKLANEYAVNLSGGQKRLLELARALMTKPAMLLLDEPMAGVARWMIDLLVERIKELNRTGLSFLVVEHDLEVIDRLCDTVYVMGQGRVLAEGSMSELREDESVVEAYLS